ncbi:hypothetical protein [Cumulibacter manganitolerans]|uniref:hypothetical protein n=1 Tax=Cumulibacter manganitolerans TaxID=1884992 RepID=UPI001296C666|nr:hypothetical protein [Cumulibacter manganitolerans]
MSRNAAFAAAAGLVALLVVLAVIALITGEPGWLLWTVVPILGVLIFFVAAVRGETLGAAKRQRDEKMSQRKSAARRARTSPGSADN